MGEINEPVRIDLTESFSAGMARASKAAHAITRSLAAMDATWEPHDWSDFK